MHFVRIAVSTIWIFFWNRIFVEVLSNQLLLLANLQSLAFPVLGAWAFMVASDVTRPPETVTIPGRGMFPQQSLSTPATVRYLIRI